MESFVILVLLLAFLAIIGAAISVVGHFSWLLFAAFFRAITGRQESTTQRNHCPVCATFLTAAHTSCPTCGWSATTGLNRLVITKKQVDELMAQGQLTPAEKQRIFTALSMSRQQRLATQELPSAASLPSRPPAEPPTVKPDEVVTAEVVRRELPPEPPTAMPPSPRLQGEDLSPTQDVTAQSHAPELSPLTPEQRVRRFSEKRDQAAAEPAPPPAPPSRAWHELVAAFMEERNMRWGELVGGLLIVCSSIALVVSLWSQIAERPIIKFGVFNGVTAALFGLGIHAARRWKLPTTSQGLLIIATLLVPLNFLAIAAFSTTADARSALAIVGELTSVIVFGLLLYLSSRIVLPKWPWVLTVGVLAQAVMELIIGRNLMSSSTLLALYAAGGACLLGYLGANLPTFIRPAGEDQSPEEWAHQIFKLLGITTFSVLLPLGLLLYRTGDVASQIYRLSPLLVLLGAPGIATGILLWQQSPLTWVRVTGASVAVGGAYVMLLSLFFAWPAPVWLLATSLLCFSVLTVVAVSFRVPLAHLVAAACLALAFVLAGHVIVGSISWDVEHGNETVRALLSAQTGRILVGFAAIYAFATWGWQRARRETETRYFAAVAAASTAISLILITMYGFGVVGDPHAATWVYLIYGGCSLVAAYCAQNRIVAAIAVGLLLPALLQGIVFRYGRQWELSYPWTFALLAHATLSACGALVVRYRERQIQRTFIAPLIAWAIFSSVVVVVIVLGAAVLDGDIIPAAYLFWLAAVWLVIAWTKNWPEMFAGFQAVLTLAVVRVVYTRLESTEWYPSLTNAWCDPWTLECVGVALALLGLCWIGLRWGLRLVGVTRPHGEFASTDELESPQWKQVAATLLYPEWPMWEQLVAGGVVILLSSLAVYGVVPGVAQELSPQASATGTAADVAGELGVGGRTIPASESFELAGISHNHALSRGAWGLLAAALVLFTLSLAEEYRFWKLCAAALTVSAGTLLLAGQWESQVAVASALRWLTAGFFALGSIVIWCRGPLLSRAERVGWMPPQGGMASFSAAFLLLIVLTVTPLVAMASFVALAAVGLNPPSTEVTSVTRLLSIVFAISALMGLSLRIATERAAALEEAPSAVLRPHLLSQISTLLLVLGAAPLVVITLLVVGSALSANPIVGPNPDSFFARIGLSASYALPLLVMALAVVGHAVRERSARIALSAGLLLSLCATAGYLLSPSSAGQLDALRWIRVAQLNAIVAAVFGMVWALALRRARTSDDRSMFAGGLLTTQVALGAAFAVLGFVPTVAHLFWMPDTTFSLQLVAGAWGWLTMTLVITSLVSLHHCGGLPSWAAIRGVGVAAIGVLISLETHRWDLGNWLAHHSLLVLSLLGSACLIALGWFLQSVKSRGLVTPWATLLLLVAVLFSLRGVGDDPQFPWWSVGGLVGSSLIAASLACWARRRRYLYAACLLFNLAASVWWIGAGHKLVVGSNMPSGLLNFIHINVIALALPAVAWLLVELRVISRRAEESTNQFGLPVHRLAVPVSLVVIGLTFSVMFLANVAAEPLGANAVISWLALLAVTCGTVACLWDQQARWALASLYLLGLAMIPLVLSNVDLSSQQLVWTGSMAIAAYSLATSYLWSRRRGLESIAARLHIPTRDESGAAELHWLIPANCLLVGIVVLLGFWSQMTFEHFSFRLASSQAVIVQAIAVGLLARGRRRSLLQAVALWLGVLGAIAFGWSWLNPATAGNVLNHAVVVAVALGGMSVLYGVGLTKILRRENEWTRAAAQTVPPLIVLALVAIAGTMAGEVYFYTDQRHVPMSWPAIAAVIVTFVGLVGASLIAAVVPGRDPLGLSERQRTVYVYAAEAQLGLLFLHIRLTMPWLFSGFFLRYWPLIVMLIAYIGVGLGEWFQRRRQKVLAEPLEKTGALLPMLPVIGYWVVPGEVHFSLLMLAVGVMYAALSVLRRSFLFGVLAALAANGGLWYLLYRADGLGLLQHPQLWLIPPSLCVLVSAYLNRERLNEAQTTTIRYVCLAMIYTSSTADVFLNGVGEAPWLPFVLAGLSIAGIFVGIMLRVRSFLFLGVSFLLLALMTVIWHAAVDLKQTWLWYVSGIIAGILIIAMFALFEKKRKELLGLVEELKHWEG